MTADAVWCRHDSFFRVPVGLLVVATASRLKESCAEEFPKGMAGGRETAYVHFHTSAGSFRKEAAVSSTVATIARGCSMSEGTVKRITDKGFGFIRSEGGEDIFFHTSNVEGISFTELREGQRVSYAQAMGPKGLRAENVRPL